jgi:hypothetical protein
LTLGLPFLAVVAFKSGMPELAALTPPGAVYLPLVSCPNISWLAGPVLAAIGTLFLARRAIPRCAAELRDWYDRNQGRKAAD